jgi:Fe-S cluster assembly protein SufD
LTLVDGVFRPDVSALPAALPARAFIGGWAQLIAENEALAQRIFARIASQDDAMAALNTALASDGAVVYLPAGARLAKPLELLSLAHGGSVHSRLTVVLEMGATATLIERHRAMREGFSNILSEIAVGDSAQLRHLRIQEASEGATHIATQAVRLGRDAHYRSLSLMMGAEVARHQVTVRLDAPGAEAQIDGLLLLRGHLHGDMTSVVEHAAPHGTSKQMVRAVLEDRAHGVFQGKIVVHEGAAKSDGAQLSNTLLLTHGTRMDVKPELEIFADDVQCSHGATTGAIDEAALFYLRSRGIPEGEARALLVQSFVSALIERLDDAALLATLEPQIAAWMGGAWAANPEGAP